jgi:hypothetical protein
MDAHSNARLEREVSHPLKIAAMLLRSLFLITLGVLVFHVSLAQIEHTWTISYEPIDVIRLLIGFFVSVWIVYHIFMLPKDPQSYRTWAYAGITLVPLILVALWAVW